MVSKTCYMPVLHEYEYLILLALRLAQFVKIAAHLKNYLSKIKFITMKKLLLSIFVTCVAGMLHAQTSNFIIFSENGERFQLVVNGVLQNAQSETNVKVTGLNAPNYKCRAMFEDTKLGYLDFNLYFTEPAYEVTYSIGKNKKGEFKTKYISAVPMAQAPPAAPTQTVVVYSTTPPPAATTTTTTTQTTTTGTTGDNVSINMGMNVDGMGGGVSINMSGMDGMGEGTSTTTTTTTHSTTTSHSSTVNGQPVTSDPIPPPATQVVYVSGYTGPVGCPIPMSQGDFESAKRSVSSKDFEDSKLTIAKQILGSNCMTCSQVRDMMNLFDFETTKLDFAKFAYGRTYDYNNYYKLNDAFTFESSISDLNAYMNGYQR